MSDTKLDALLEGQRTLERKVDMLNERVPCDLPVRLDRLEQSEKRRNWWTGLAATTGVGALVAAGWSLLTTGKPTP